MKRQLMLVIALCLVSFALHSGVELVSVDSYPTQLALSWRAVSGADYYDLYLDKVPVKRVRQRLSTTLGREGEPLEAGRTYELIIVARKEGDVQLASSAQWVATAPLYTPEFRILATHATASSIEIYWTMIEGADYYDVYLDRLPMGRIRGGYHTTLGSNENPLSSHRQYEVLVVARTDGGGERALSIAVVETGGWEGRYRWVNQTKSTNKGRATQLEFRVTYHGGGYRIEGLYDTWHDLFPLVEESMIGRQFDYDGESSFERAYRSNVQTFNTTSIKPVWRKVVSSSSTANSATVDVRSRARGIEVVTRSIYRFVITDEGEAELHFTTTADGIAALSIFRSPNKGDDGVFRASKI